jgi:YcaO-like protein with predicted kinase domain
MEILWQNPNKVFLDRKKIVFSIEEAYRKSLDLKKQIGVSRVAEIGQFVDAGIFVCQATRPNLFYHYSTGLNTGSQGKGYTLENACLSAVMESAEAFCGEPRSPNLIRGAYSELKKCHFIASPRSFIPENAASSQVSFNEPLMWTKALHFDSKKECLIPAELVYFFLMPEFYNCHSAFQKTSGGLGAGFDIQTATKKAILEKIEDHYIGHFERLDVKVEQFFIEGPLLKLVRKMSKTFRNDYDTLFFAISLKKFKYSLPFIVCYMGDSQHFYTGYGIGLDPLKAAQSAHLEAFQGWATNVSGAREDLSSNIEPADHLKTNNCFEKIWPDSANLKFEDFEKRFGHLTNFSQKTKAIDDVDLLASILKKNGFPNLYLTNLSRNGVDCYVVRAVIPGLWNWNSKYKRPERKNQLDFSNIVDKQFLINRRRENRKTR